MQKSLKKFNVLAWDYWKPELRTTFCLYAKTAGQAQGLAEELLRPQMGTGSVVRLKEIKAAPRAIC